ncbi:MAG: DUF262 domain-containing protein [Thermotogota bacterium]|nr:DUF262 domain-containing protein [Thermotogota bacterium]
MSTFDSTKNSLENILNKICSGKIQLPDFQRGWIWDDNHIRDLLVSVARSFPVGAVMMLETGGAMRFQTRPIEGLEKSKAKDSKPEKLILDGQQRLTTLTQAIALTSPVNTRTSKGKEIKRHYYFDIQQALATPNDLDIAIIGVDENKQIRKNFGRDIVLDLSTREKECEQLYFPCDQIMNSDKWEMMLYEVAPDNFPKFMVFRSKILDSFRHYQLPIIELHKETSKEAVCIVFEKVNTGGVQLSVFELITASYAADGYNLRDDWYGSDLRQVESRKERIAQDPLLSKVEATDFLQAITLLYTRDRKKSDIKEGKSGKQVRPVSAKRADVIDLPLSAWKELADQVEQGFKLAGKFLKKESFYSQKEIPYSTQIVPLAAILSYLKDRWLEPKIYDKLSKWFWCGVLGELYGGAVETRIANDYEQLINWFEDDESLPRTILDANFQTDRFYTLKSRLSAAYKGINVLVLRNGATDWYWKAGIQELDVDEVALDIHHIFPKDWCQKHNISKDTYDCILNKTPLSYRANRKIGGYAPSVYLPKLQQEKNVELSDSQMDSILQTHLVSANFLRTDDYEGFIQDRSEKLKQLIEKAMGKEVSEAEDIA